MYRGKANTLKRAPRPIYMYMVLEILALEMARRETIWQESSVKADKPVGISRTWLYQEVENYLGDRGFFKIFGLDMEVITKGNAMWKYRVSGICASLLNNGYLSWGLGLSEEDALEPSYAVTTKGLDLVLPYNLHIEERCGHCYLYDSEFPSWQVTTECPSPVEHSTLPDGLGGSVDYGSFMDKGLSYRPRDFDVVRTLSHRQVIRGIAISDDLREELETRYGAIYHYSRN
ncbi:MAG: hypothetical protein VX966_08910 [Chloroflexota bacterium]|nr:hypothetical protein [Chloroflexota bacterium]